jgi:small subunit ribosomal protein S9
MEGKKYYATGRRKTSVARVRMEPGQGAITINDRSLDEFFGGLITKKVAIRQPLVLTNFNEKYDLKVNVHGGGPTGQAEAIRHGIARTLIIFNPEYRAVLKRAGLLSRDPRKKERKKYGLKGARKRFQYSKR